MKAFLFLAPYARRYWKALAVTLASMVFLVGVQLLAPWIIREMIGMVKDGIDPGSYRQIGQLALFALGVYAIGGVFTFLRSYMAHVPGGQ